MKITSKLFLASRKESVTTLVIKQEHGRSFMYTCFNNKYTDNLEFMETEASITISKISNQDVNSVCFALDMYKKSNEDFLKSLKIGMDLEFKVLAHNSSEAWKSQNFTSHELSVEINGKERLLDVFVGFQNSASPVQ
jgi:hypothetical protein